MTDDHPSAGRPDDLGLPERDPEQLPPLIRPAVDRIARIRATIHAKLLAGFLIIAALLLAMGVTSILVIRQMNERAHDQIMLRDQSDLARQAIYFVTSQSHYRAMALTTFDDYVERQDRDRQGKLHGGSRLHRGDRRTRRARERRTHAGDRRAVRDGGRRGAVPLSGGRVRSRAGSAPLRRARDLARHRGRAQPAHLGHRGARGRERREPRVTAPVPACRRRDLLRSEPADRPRDWGRRCRGRSSAPSARSTSRSRGSPVATSASMSRFPTATSSAGSPST